MEPIVLELVGALSLLLDRVDSNGHIDPIADEGPLQDARNVLDKARAEMDLVYYQE